MKLISGGSRLCKKQPVLQIVEDAAQQLEAKVGGQRPSEVLVPRLLLLFKSEQQDAKCLAVAILNLLALKMPAALADSLDMCVSFTSQSSPLLSTPLVSNGPMGGHHMAHHLGTKEPYRNSLGSTQPQAVARS